MGRNEDSSIFKNFKKLKTGSTNAAGQITYLIHNGCLTRQKWWTRVFRPAQKGIKKVARGGFEPSTPRV